MKKNCKSEVAGCSYRAAAQVWQTMRMSMVAVVHFHSTAVMELAAARVVSTALTHLSRFEQES